MYRDDEGTMTEIQLDCAKLETTGKKACEKSDFTAFIGTKLALANTVDCDTDYPSGDHTYADTDAFLNELLKEIGVYQQNF